MPELTITEILLIINTILTVVVPAVTTFFVKIRKSKCMGRWCSVDVERDTNSEESPILQREKNAFTTKTSLKIRKTESALVKAEPIQ